MRILLIVAAVIAAIVISSWTYGRALQHRAEEVAWPNDLGALSEAPRHFPAHGATPGALRLNKLVEPFGLDLIVLSRPELKHDRRLVSVLQWVDEELERNELPSQPVPAAVSGFVADNAQSFDVVRQQAIAGGPIAFEVDITKKEPPLDPGAIQQLCRLLAADALARRDEVAWRDLEASWRVAQSLLDRPETDSYSLGIVALQWIESAARKLPPPAPAWLAELRAADLRGSYVKTLQATTWKESRHPFFLDVMVHVSATHINDQRESAEAVAKETCCAFGGDEEDLRRLFALRADMELTERVLAARAGGAANPQSSCRDGHWNYEAADGGTKIAFSMEIDPPVEFLVKR